MEHNQEICLVVGGPQKRWQWIVEYLSKNTGTKIRVCEQGRFSFGRKIINSYVLVLKDLIDHRFKNEIIKCTGTGCTLVYSDRTRPGLIKAFEIMGISSLGLTSTHSKEDKVDKVDNIVFGTDINELVHAIASGTSWSRLHTKLVLESKVNVEQTPFVEQVTKCAKANCLSIPKNPPNRSQPKTKIDPEFYPNLVPEVLRIKATNSWIDTFRILYNSGVLHPESTLSGFTQGIRAAIAKTPGTTVETTSATETVVPDRQYSAVEYDEVFSKWHEGEEALKAAKTELEEKSAELRTLEGKFAAVSRSLRMMANRLNVAPTGTKHDPIFLKMLVALESSCTERGPFHALCKTILED